MLLIAGAVGFIACATESEPVATASSALLLTDPMSGERHNAVNARYEASNAKAQYWLQMADWHGVSH